MTLTEHIRICKTYSDETILGSIRQLSANINRRGYSREWEGDRLRALKIVAQERKISH